MRQQLKQLLKDYSLEEILEIGDVDPIDALELLIQYDVVSLDEIIEGADRE